MKLLMCVMVAMTFGMSSFPKPAHERAASPIPVEGILQGHGGLDAVAAIDSYTVAMTKIAGTVSPKFYAQEVRLSVEGDKIRRETLDARDDIRRVEIIDGNGQFSVAMIRDEAGGGWSGPLTLDSDRQSIVRANVAVTSLIPLLKAISDPAAIAYYLGRGQGEMDKYLIAAARRQFIVYLDNNSLICRVEVGRNTFEFSDFKQVGSLRLPFVERVSVGGRQVFELFFSEFELNPAFEYNHFSRML